MASIRPSRRGLHRILPGGEPDLHVHAHLAGDGAGQLNREAGGTAPLIEKLEGRISVVAADHDGAVRRQFQMRKPFCMQAAVGAVGHAERQSLVEQRQRRAVAFLHREAEVLREFQDRRLDEAQPDKPVSASRRMATSRWIKTASHPPAARTRKPRPGRWGSSGSPGRDPCAAGIPRHCRLALRRRCARAGRRGYGCPPYPGARRSPRAWSGKGR